MYLVLGIASTGLFGKYPLIIYSIFLILFAYMGLKRRIICPKNKNFYIIILFSLLYTVVNYIKYR